MPSATAHGNVARVSNSERPTHPWAGLAVLAAGLALIVMDGTIVSVAQPVIIQDLDLTLTDAQWINSLYSVVFAALLLGMGRLGDRLGRRHLFVAGIAVFVIGSLLAANSDAAAPLIWARVVQGVGGALILPSTLSTVNAVFRGKDRAMAFGVWGAVMAGAAAIGPLLGGWLTSSFAWEWIFLINVPLGLILFIAAFFLVPNTRGRAGGRGLDVDGLQLSVIGLGAFVFAVIEGSDLGWWVPQQDFTVFGLTWSTDKPVSIIPIFLLIGAISMTLFIIWERHRARIGRSAMLDLALFKIPTFSWGNITAATVAIGEFALIFVLPLFLVNALGLSTLGAGFVLAGMAGGAFISGASARHLADRFGPPVVVLIGLGLEIIGVIAAILILDADSSPVLLTLLLAIYGLGLGLASAQLTSTVLQDVPTDVSGQGSATQSTVRQVGTAIGIAVSGAVLSIGLSQGPADRLATISGLPPEAADQLAGATRSSAGGVISGLREQGTSGDLGDVAPRVVDALSQAFASATRWAMFSAVVFLVIGFIGALRVRKAARQMEGSPAK